MSGAPLNVYLLFEHQSTVDGCMALRLLMYMTGIWQKVLKENPNGPFKLPSVVPVVLYQAADRWTAATEFSSVFDVSEGGMVRFIPKFDYALFDLGNTDPAEIPGPPQVQMVLRVMRAMYLEMDAYLKALESEVGPIDAALGEGTQEHLATGRSKKIRSAVMSIAETLIQKGEIQGLERSIEKGRQDGRRALTRNLARRFGEAGEALRPAVETITDLDLLEDLRDDAVAASLETIQAKLT